ncbi:Uncharacterised protein [Corynebacterium renale]|uniref:PPA1309 family protein n=1 Tax=Corynebacterium renale TaxID=1724 RepID=UPI000DA32BB3|nr:PPA1309 family protein [Corynebacterium renale]SQG64211.1 Uncharacterised protein [Corynebacterium renale]
MTQREQTQQALNKAMVEAIEYVHAEGWDGPPVLFGLVSSKMLADADITLTNVDDEDTAPLTLIVQDNLPENIEPGSAMLADYLTRIAWPPHIEGVVLTQEIMFKDSSAGPDAPARPARLISGVLREGAEQTLLQLRPTEEELEEAGPFAQDDIQLRGGPGVAPNVIAALKYGLEADPEQW